MAFKIFELGLKKYGDIPEYVLAYIDYLSHLNGKSQEEVIKLESIIHCVFFSTRILIFIYNRPKCSENNKYFCTNKINVFPKIECLILIIDNFIGILIKKLDF